MRSEDHILSHPWLSDLSGQRICILTFGCTYNEGDSSRLQTLLSSVGSIIVSDFEDADIVILNTCVVVEKTELKMIRLLRDLTSRGKTVFVTGCLPAARPDILIEFEGVNVLLPEEIHVMSEDVMPMVTDGIAVVQIGSGCLGSCTYCITRYARGRIQSIPEDQVLSQIAHAAAQGAGEIRLTGQDLSAYGCEKGFPSLPSLLRKISSLPGHFRVRLGMMNPATLIPISTKVAEYMQNPHFFAFLHIPVQSGSDRIISKMGREYTLSEYYELVRIFRETIPGITIATDLISGFPGETDEDFRASCELLEELRPGMVHVTRYSYRPGSTIGRKDELPDRIRKDRSRELIKIGYSILGEEKQKIIGSLCKVLVTEKIRPGTVFGRTEAYCGVVIHEDLPIGTECVVEMTGEKIHYLTGRLISCN